MSDKKDGCIVAVAFTPYANCSDCETKKAIVDTLKKERNKIGEQIKMIETLTI